MILNGDYEFLSLMDKLMMVNDHLRELEREHFSWKLNLDRVTKMSDSLDMEKNGELAQAGDQIQKLTLALERAHEQREEIIGALSSKVKQ